MSARCDPQQMCSPDSLPGSSSSLSSSPSLSSSLSSAARAAPPPSCWLSSLCCSVCCQFYYFIRWSGLGNSPLRSSSPSCCTLVAAVTDNKLPFSSTCLVVHSYRCYCSGCPVQPARYIPLLCAWLPSCTACFGLARSGAVFGGLCTPCGLVDGWPRDRSLSPRRIHAPLSSLPGAAIDLTLRFRSA